MGSNDRPPDKNLGSDIITDKVRVSTAMVPTYIMHVDGWFDTWETWIFSKDPNQANTQVHHLSEAAAVRAHGHIVRNMRAKFQGDDHG